MLKSDAQWRPGSFTKNYAWGQPKEGLRRLHEAIRVGFNNDIVPVSRNLFRSRISGLGRPDFIPLNFFLLNAIQDGESVILVDELVYQALTRPHDADFDSLALLAFNNSFVGTWVTAEGWQRYPAVWAFHYITERLALQLRWDTDKVDADDIEEFVSKDPRYQGATSRKLATNLAYMYKVGGIAQLSASSVDENWANAVFLALDRLSAESSDFDAQATMEDLLGMLRLTRFDRLSGIDSFDRQLALEPLCRLYSACGGLSRWTVERVHERQHILIPHVNQYLGSNQPWAVVDPLDPSLIKAIPQACAMLARYFAKFEDVGDPAKFDVISFVKDRTQNALYHLRALHINPRMSAEDLLKLTRD